VCHAIDSVNWNAEKAKTRHLMQGYTETSAKVKQWTMTSVNNSYKNTAVSNKAPSAMHVMQIKET